MEYFVYRLKNARTYGDYVFHSEILYKAMDEAKAHKKATGDDYGVFERKCVWNTLDVT